MYTKTDEIGWRVRDQPAPSKRQQPRRNKTIYKLAREIDMVVGEGVYEAGMEGGADKGRF